MAPSLLAPFVTLAATFTLFSQAGAVIQTSGDFEVTNAVVSPDGYSRSAVTVGGGPIGTLITANKGDNLQINVINNLDNSDMLEDTTVHWHGMFMAGSSWADGPAFVTQCPIVPGDSFLYDFTALDQAGTFWYHSHLSTQYCDGLKGPMVIYDPDDPYADDYDVDDETTVWTLTDWYHDFAPDLDGTFSAPDSQLFNGLGRSSTGDATDLGVANVTSGQKYRIRLVNAACDADYVFSIDNHTFTIIEVDGVNHESLEVDQLQIYAGQRYSIILNADQDVDNYWIRFNPSVGTTGFDGGINSAILRYDGADEDSEPTTSETDSSNALVESNLVPLENPGAPGTSGVGNADININLDLAFTSDAQFTVNDVVYSSPTVPVLLQILSGASSASSLLESDSLYTLGLNKVVELSIPGGVVGGEHPFHLHGHTFDVVRSAGSDDYNYDNPPRRDVVSIGNSGDNVTIRFTTDNYGPWFFHCHIDWHLEVGLAIVFAEDADDWDDQTIPTAWDDLCPTYNETLSRRSLTALA